MTNVRSIPARAVEKLTEVQQNVLKHVCLLSIRSGVRTSPESPLISISIPASYTRIRKLILSPDRLTDFAVFCRILRKPVRAIRSKFVAGSKGVSSARSGLRSLHSKLNSAVMSKVWNEFDDILHFKKREICREDH
jgi:hypothetical protein